MNYSLVRRSLVFTLVVLAACGDDAETVVPLDLTAATAPIELGGVEATYYEGISYGPFVENLFDIYLPAATEPTPLVLFIHGGGFTGGTRDTSNRGNVVTEHLAEGIAFASIDYRLLDSPDTEGVIKALQDSARGLQFIRYHAEQFNIDPAQVVLRGSSAGAGTALWIGFNDDMADSGNEDPVLRQSTRVSGVVALATQSTYDIGKWSTVVFDEFMLDLLVLADAIGLGQRLLDFYGIDNVEAFDSADILDYRQRVDMLELMTADDPPFFADNQLQDTGAPLTADIAFHHGNHALSLQEQAAAVGLSNVTYAPAIGVTDPSGQTALEFTLQQLGR